MQTLPPDNAPLLLDTVNECLWMGHQRVDLTPKSFSMLRCLVAHRPNLVTKHMLLDAVWSNTRVEEGQVKQFIAELRRVLHDNPASPRLIENVHGRGYRFIGPIEEGSAASLTPTRCQVSEGVPVNPYPQLFGRSQVLTELHRVSIIVLAGQPMMTLLTGESGIGKTTLATAFVHSLTASGRFQLMHSQCFEHDSDTDPYAPFIEAIRRLRTGTDIEAIDTLLEKYAPWWFAHSNRENQPRPPVRSEEYLTSTAHHWREFRDFMRGLSALKPTLLWVEDLHLAPAPTLNLLHYLTRQAMLGPVLLLATCQLPDELTSDLRRRALAQLLCASRGVSEIRVGPLDNSAVESLVQSRWSDQRVHVAPWIAHYGQGNPALMTRLVDRLRQESPSLLDGLCADSSSSDDGFPLPRREDLLHFLHQVGADLLHAMSTQDRDLLELASVAGERFSATTLAHLLDASLERVERQCESLSGSARPLRRVGATQWPDGIHAGEYVFATRLGHAALYYGVAPFRRASLHRQIGACLEQICGAHPAEAAEHIARHFDRGGDYPRALNFYLLAREQHSVQSNRVRASSLSRNIDRLRHLTDPTIPDEVMCFQR